MVSAPIDAPVNVLSRVPPPRVPSVTQSCSLAPILSAKKFNDIENLPELTCRSRFKVARSSTCHRSRGTVGRFSAPSKFRHHELLASPNARPWARLRLPRLRCRSSQRHANHHLVPSNHPEALDGGAPDFHCSA